MKANVLVTGGAGYIGSHVVKTLHQVLTGKIVVLDNLSTGCAEFVQNAELIVGDIRDQTLINNVLQQEQISAVMHLAAKTSVPESVDYPQNYYDTNTVGTLRLLQACQSQRIEAFLFSSTAAVYGLPQSPTVSENAPTKPINPYGHSKLMAEQMLSDCAKASNIRYIILRYFNVAGADPDGQLGQRGKKAEHLIKVALETACGKRNQLPIFGDDYDTTDGTCERDFIHVNDIAKAHVDALAYLLQGGENKTLNCGYGRGYSIKQVIKTIETITGMPLKTTIAPRRPGDSPSVIATNDQIKQTLNWRPQFDDLEFIIRTAYDWEQKAG